VAAQHSLVRIRRCAIAAIVIVAIVLVFLRGGALLDLAKYEREEVHQILNGEMSVGWRYVPRFGDGGGQPYRRLLLWDERTGFLVYEAKADEGLNVYTSRWSPEGELLVQTKFEPEVLLDSKESPPWWWEKRDQEGPTSPWGASSPDE
jgi:hypothetical protein